MSGQCVTDRTESIRAIGTVEGAPEGTVVEQEALGDEVCVLDEAQGLLCTLSPGGKLRWVAPEVAGHRFVGWSGKDARCSGSEPKLELEQLKRDTTCIARYVRRIRVQGVVAGDGDSGLAVIAQSDAEFAQCDGDSCEVDQGSTVTLEAPQRDGFRLDGFDGEGCEQREGYRVSIVTAERDVTCSARYLESLTVRGQAQGLREGASAPIVPSSAQGTCDAQLCAIEPGATVELRAPDVPGHRFRGWSGDPACTGNGQDVSLQNVQTNILCIADYIPRFSVEGNSQGASAPISAQSSDLFSACTDHKCEVDQGQTVVLLAGSVNGYRLDRWSGEGCEQGDGDSANVSDVRQNRACIAHFVRGVAVSGTVVNATGTVVASSTSSGAACDRGRCSIDVGGTVSLTAPNLPGRSFTGWMGDPGCTGTSRTLLLSNVNESKACRAVFAPRHIIAGAAQPAAAGSIAAASSATNASCNGARCEVDQGANVSLTATPNDDFRFTGWSGGGPCTGSANRLELRNVSSAITCGANFIARVTVSANVAPANAGSVAASSLSTAAACSAGACTVDRDARVMLTANPNDGFRFSGWTGCETSAVSPLIVSARSDTRCTANFVRITYSANASAGAGGSVSARAGSGASCNGTSCTVEHGGAVSFTAEPASGYSFAGWSDCSNSSQPTVSLTVTANRTCRASFARIRLTVSATATNGGSVTASTGGNECFLNSCNVDHGASVTVRVNDTPGIEFVNWSGCSNSTQRTLTLNNVTSNQTCTANFRGLTYTVSASAGAGGSVRASSGVLGQSCPSNRCTVAFGGSATLVASADPGYEFSSWSGTGCGGGATLDLSDVRGDIACSASFSRLGPFTVSARAPGHSPGASTGGNSCAGATCSVPYGGGASLSVTVVWGVGNIPRLVRWRGCDVRNLRLEMITTSAPSNSYRYTGELSNVTRDLECVAEFEPGYMVLTSVRDPAQGRTEVTLSGASLCNTDHPAPGMNFCVAAAGVPASLRAFPSGSYLFDHFECNSEPTSAANPYGPPQTAAGTGLICTTVFRTPAPELQ